MPGHEMLMLMLHSQASLSLPPDAATEQLRGELQFGGGLEERELKKQKKAKLKTSLDYGELKNCRRKERSFAKRPAPRHITHTLNLKVDNK